MTNADFLRSRFAAVAFFSVSLFTPAAPALAASPTVRALTDPVIEVTSADVDASNRKVAGAYGALVTMWNKDFTQIGQRFVAPRIARYTGAVRTSCGVIRPNNAEYCYNSNTIYYDEVFVAGMT